MIFGKFAISVDFPRLADFREFFLILFFVMVTVMVCPYLCPCPENNIFLLRERILKVSERGGGYIGFGFDFSGSPANRSENPRNSQEHRDCGRFGFVGKSGTSDIESNGRRAVSRMTSGIPGIKR
jgi:hypothetical protein